MAAAIIVTLVGGFLALHHAPGRLQTSGPAIPFVRISPSRPAPELHFEDAADRPLSLADFRGKVVLLDVWASWCLPCRRELPALDRVQQVLGGPDFQVVALSIDTGGAPAVKRYFDTLGMHALGVYVDPTMQVANVLGMTGTPTTILIDGSGSEVGRRMGPAKWDSPANEQFLRAFIAASAPRAAQPGS